METKKVKPPLRAVVEQTTNNITSWIGHWQGDTKNRISGQTFTCPSDGELDSIEVFSAHVSRSGPVNLTIHLFNADTKTWGPVLQSSSVEFNRSDNNKWISFHLNGLQLKKATIYGFRLKSETGLVGIGEAAGNNMHQPYKEGQKWFATSEEQPGSYFNYLSLAFKVDMRA